MPRGRSSCFGANTGSGASTFLTNWPAGTEPRDAGKRVAENWASRPSIFEAGRAGRYDEFVHYAEVGTWYGALSVARLTRDTALQRRLVTKYDRLRTPDGARHISARA
ncbi:MAG TPA: hypothetical protein VFT29_08360 [Gemmatimonadaceae bacterium]|nr:hypothetical protein [Gemmatimonadaceae bacterium]